MRHGDYRTGGARVIQPLLKVPRARERDQKDRDADRKWYDVCRQVERRDGFRCRCCKGKVVKTMRRQGDRMEHHHVIPRSLGGPDEVWNIAITCLTCHDDRHVTRRLHITGNADEQLVFEKDGVEWRG